jgi:glucokinase
MSHYIGIDIGGSKISAGIVSNTGKVIQRKDCPTPVISGGPKILQDAIALTADLMQSFDQKIVGLGVGAGGQIDAYSGVVLSATDVLPGWQGIRIAETFSKHLDVQTFVENDVNTRALGEARFGAAASMPDNCTIVFLLLDAGVGGAILLNGSVHHGAHWSGGEFGQILLTMGANVRRAPGGGVGTLEAYCSTSGLVQTWRELSDSSNATVTAQDICNEAKSNPKSVAAAAVAKTGEYLGFGLVSLTNAIRPHIIIIGGELATLGDILLNPAKEVLTSRSLTGSATCAVAQTNLGPDVAVIGAASLAMLKCDVSSTPEDNARVIGGKFPCHFTSV